MKFEETLGSISTKISNQRHLRSIRDAFMLTLPLTLVGSISLLVAQPPITQTTNSVLLAIKDLATSHPGLIIPYNLTTGIYGLWVVLAVAYCHAKEMKVNEMSSVLMAGVSFLCIASIPDKNMMPMANIGAKGIFGAMMIGLVSVEVFAWFIHHNIKIKMPPSVPQGVSAPFEALLAFAAVMLLIIGVNTLCVSLCGKDFITATMAIFQPLIMSSDTLLALIVCVVLQRALWFFGIHGGSVTGAILNPILMANLVANQEAFAAGKELPFVFTNPVFSGSLWGLSFLPAAIVMMFWCRSTRLKTVGKLGVVPAFCGIGEPINFGTPFVLNMTLLIPGILQFVVNCGAAYVCMQLGLINRVIVSPPLGIPTIIGVVLASMDYRAIVLWIILFIVDILMYLPFFKIYDRQCLEEEQIALKQQESQG